MAPVHVCCHRGESQQLSRFHCVGGKLPRARLFRCGERVLTAAICRKRLNRARSRIRSPRRSSTSDARHSRAPSEAPKRRATGDLPRGLARQTVGAATVPPGSVLLGRSYGSPDRASRHRRKRHGAFAGKASSESRDDRSTCRRTGDRDGTSPARSHLVVRTRTRIPPPAQRTLRSRGARVPSIRRTGIRTRIVVRQTACSGRRRYSRPRPS